ncbi:hypothetical protein BC941DRAFT_429762 [Chlamydoabsidia padenii]|nr:hypothetical protein BC941DRAFT_429762 [Chlamydoabsidia padenii]
MLVILLNSSIFLTDLIIKTFVLATCTYFLGNPLFTLVKLTLYTNQHTSSSITPTHSQDNVNNTRAKKKKHGNESGNMVDNEPIATSILTKQQQFTMDPTLHDVRLDKKETQSANMTMQPLSPCRRRTQSFPCHFNVSHRSPALTPSRSVTLPCTKRRDSRVGQLVQRFETGRSSDGLLDCHSTNIDMIHTSGNKRHTLIPFHGHSPSTLTSPVSTRAIDYRSIGFRPAFTTWEKRITEGNPLLVPIPSRSFPVWSTKLQGESSPTTLTGSS